MPINNGGGGGGITIEQDPNSLPLTGGIMSGAIRFDTVGSQCIQKGSFDTGYSAYNGISLVCANDVELNWQAGFLKAKYNNAFVPIKVDGDMIFDTRGDLSQNDGPWAEAWSGGFGAENSSNGHSAYFDSEGFYLSGNGKAATLSNTDFILNNLPITSTIVTGDIAGVYARTTLTQTNNSFKVNHAYFDGNDGNDSDFEFNSINGLTVGGNRVAFANGDTFTGKLTLSPTGITNAGLNLKTGVTPTSSVAGDIWISVSSMRYKDSTGTERLIADANRSNTFTSSQTIQATNNTSPALKITQLGTGEALRVEDETSPDATAFVVNNSGRVGIGTTPDATVALTVDSTGVKFSDSSVQITKGDRYKATSTTSMVIDGTNAKVFTTQPNLAYTKFQKCTVYPTAGTTEVMFCQVNSYNPTTGDLSLDSLTHTGSGTFANWVINVGG